MSKLTVMREFANVRWFRRFSSRRGLERYQQKQLAKHLSFLLRHSPYFRRRAARLSRLPFTQWPLIDKAVMMRNFNTMNTVGISKQAALHHAIASEKSRDFSWQYSDISVGLSSGTSGHRGMFIVGNREREQWAGTILARMLPKNKILGHRVAFFLRADNSLYQTVASRALQFEYFDIYKNMDEHIERLGEYKPTLLVAPPSVLLVIAEAVENGLILPPLDRVIAVAEVLTKADELRLKKVFRQPMIHQVYQCTEGLLGFTCNEGTMHLNEEVIYVEKEYLDEHRYIPIITDFKRTSQPIVRYRLNDILVERVTPCVCGSSLAAIERIEGREGDVFIFKDTKQNDVTVFSDMISRCMIYASGFGEYRVVQTGYDHLVVSVDVLDAAVKKSVRSEFDRLARTLSYTAPKITFTNYKRDLSKKLRRIERAFDV